ncbi:unnamed protein product [Fusarium graminearum]|nr:unnamed protein product [Fusarium graminearum]
MKITEEYCGLEPPVQKLEIREAYEQLSTQEKCYAHYMREAAFHGSRIIMRQVSPESETIFNLIIQLWRTCDGDWASLAMRTSLDEQAISQFLDYAATAMENLGNYKGYGDQKFIPRIAPHDLEKLCLVSPDALELFNLARPFIFGITPKTLGYPDEGGMSNYYPESPHLTKEEIRAVGDATCSKLSLRNTRLQKLITESGVEYHLLVASVSKHPAKPELQNLVLPDGSKVIVKYGDHSDDLSRICDSLAKAKDFAASKEQENYLSKLISFYQTGDIDTHKEAAKDWLADDAPCVETWGGFLEPGRDPNGVRCEFEALVAVKDKRWSEAFGQLSSRAEQFILQLPWSGLGPDGKELGPFENDTIAKANFVALNLLCYCASNVWTGLTAPGYPEIKAEIGQKNMTFSNRVAANNASGQEHRFLNPVDVELFEANRSLCFFLQLALHELIGHSCGKLFQETESGYFNFDPHKMPKNPFTGKPVESWYGLGETPETSFGGIATAYIECLAEGIGLYLMSADGVLGTLAPDTTSNIDEVVYIGYLSIACMGLRALLSYNPGTKKWGQVHDQARFGLLKCFLNAGHGFATIEHATEEPNSVKIVMSREKIATVGRPALGSLIHELHIARCTKSVKEGSDLFENLTAVDEVALRWRAAVEAIKGPRTLFVHPNTKLENGIVSLFEYPETKQGLIQSWVDRQLW